MDRRRAPREAVARRRTRGHASAGGDLALRLLALLLVVPLLGCGQTARVHSPFTVGDGEEAGGTPVLEVGPTGTVLRFVPDASFAIGIVLRNRASRPVTLVDVRTVDPPGTLVRNVGTSLGPWNPQPCPHSCPGVGFLRPPYAPATPQPVVVRAGAEVAVQLDFRMPGCDAVPLAVASAARVVVATYRAAGGTSRQSIALRSQRLRLRMPSKRDCDRPQSSIAVTAPFSSGSTWTVPASAGDDCTRAPGGGLVFTSRLFQAPLRPAVRVKIVLPRFRGVGLYRTTANGAAALGPALAVATVAVGPRGRTTFRSSTAFVTVVSATRTAVKGRFHATFTGRTRSRTFRAYGGWRCTIS